MTGQKINSFTFSRFHIEITSIPETSILDLIYVGDCLNCHYHSVADITVPKYYSSIASQLLFLTLEGINTFTYGNRFTLELQKG